jgi:hypothetical protein
MKEPNHNKILEQFEKTGLGSLPEEDFSLLEEPKRIRSFEDVPNIWTMEIKPVEWIVDSIAARKNITLWAGTDGTAKTYLAQSMAVAVGTGGEFLGKRCKQTPVLYCDFENADYLVRDRLELMTTSTIDTVRFWGMWVDPQPPPIGSELLLKIAKESQPLMIFDPFRYSHLSDENDSTEMMMIMKHLRSYATAGAAVVILHHPAKAEGSTGRGSSAIRGACDIAWLQEMSDETGLLTLKCGKNRGGNKPTIHVQPDFDAGRFQVIDSPAWMKHREEIQKLRDLITSQPGLSQNQIFTKAGGNRNSVTRMLKEHAGREWRTETGQRGSLLYYPLVSSSKVQVGIPGTGGGTVTCIPVPTPIVGTGQYSVTAPVLTCTGTNHHECYVHGEHATFYRSPSGSPVCGLCHPQVTQ